MAILDVVVLGSASSVAPRALIPFVLAPPVISVVRTTTLLIVLVGPLIATSLLTATPANIHVLVPVLLDIFIVISALVTVSTPPFVVPAARIVLGSLSALLVAAGVSAFLVPRASLVVRTLSPVVVFLLLMALAAPPVAFLVLVTTASAASAPVLILLPASAASSPTSLLLGTVLSIVLLIVVFPALVLLTPRVLVVLVAILLAVILVPLRIILIASVVIVSLV